jgi:undecaprenyl-diphosphatase
VGTIEAILLGVLQGLTEFLPVSSSGHLVLAERAFGWEGGGLAFEVSVHLATLLAVLIVLRRDVAGLVRGALDLARLRTAGEDARLLLFVAIGTVPAVVVGLLLKDAVEEAFDSPRFAAAGLLVTAAILLSTRWRRREERPLGAVAAIAIGCAQALAIAPGISRSGSTIAAALLLGIAASRAFTFSFLLSIPAILGATVLELAGESLDPGLLRVCLVAGTAAFLSGTLALVVLRGVVQRGRLALFAPYCVAVGILALILLS